MRISVIVAFLLVLAPRDVVSGSWSLGVSGSPGISIPRTESDLPSPRQRFAYSVGIAGTHDWNSSLFTKAGLQYSRKDFIIAKGIPDTRNAIDPSTGRIDPSRIVYGEAFEVFESLSIPLSVNYRVLRGGAIDLLAFGGIEFGVLFRRKAILEPTVTGTSEHVESASGFIWSVLFGGGVSYAASDHIAVLLLPQYSFSRFPEQSSGSLSFQSFSLECAILYRF